MRYVKVEDDNPASDDLALVESLPLKREYRNAGFDKDLNIGAILQRSTPVEKNDSAIASEEDCCSQSTAMSKYHKRSKYHN